MKVKTILVSQPKPADFEKSPYGELSKNFNLKIDFEKFISVEGISSKEFRMNKQSLYGHTAVILTSRHAVDHFFRIAKELRYEIPASMKYFCISESTAYYLQKYIQYRKRKTFRKNSERKIRSRFRFSYRISLEGKTVLHVQKRFRTRMDVLF